MYTHRDLLKKSVSSFLCVHLSLIYSRKVGIFDFLKWSVAKLSTKPARTVHIILITFILFGNVSAQILSPTQGSEVAVIIDADAPNVTILSPGSISYATTTSLLLEFTIVEQSPDRVWYILNTNAPVFVTSSVPLALPSGTHTLTLYANDTFGRVGSDSVMFTVSDELPGCGDALCTAGENCNSCSSDCGVCPVQANSGGGGGSSGGNEQARPQAEETVEGEVVAERERLQEEQGFPESETPQVPPSSSITLKYNTPALIALVVFLVGFIIFLFIRIVREYETPAKFGELHVDLR